MSIIEIIQKAGIENVRVQSLASDFSGMRRQKDAALVTFVTSHEMASSITREANGIPGTHFGLVVWVPRTLPEKAPPTTSTS